MASVLFCQFVLLLVSTSFHVVHPQCVNQCVATVAEGTWNSGLRVTSSTPNSLFVEWNQDTQTPSTGYVVQYQRIGDQSFTKTDVLSTSATSFNITGLAVSTMYDLMVCRGVSVSGRTDNCGSCLLCAMTPLAQVAPSPPRSLRLVTANPQSLSLTWEEPAELNAIKITNYTITCVGSDSATRTTIAFQQFFAFVSDLTPETQYNCSVVAFNEFGGSSPAVLITNTTKRTDDPGALLIFTKPNLVYTTVTADLISSSQCNMNSLLPTLFTTTDDIKDIDYDYQRSLLYFTSENTTSGQSAVKIAQIQLGMNDEGTFNLSLVGEVETLLALDDEGTVGEISVDWVNLEIFYTIRMSSTSRIFRLVLNETGSEVVARACVAELTNTNIANIRVDPVHGFFYYSTDTTIFRVDLSQVQANSMTCPTSINSGIVRSFDTLYAFMVEQEDIYILAQEQQICPNTTAALSVSVNLGGESNSTLLYSSTPAFGTRHLDSYTQYMIIGTGVNYVYASTASVATSCGPRNFILCTLSESISLIRMLRSSQQPAPVPLNSPTAIKVSTEGRMASISWNAPVFPGSLYSADAFDDWTYSVKYCEAGTQSCQEDTTVQTSIQLTVQNDTTYVVTVSAVGPGGQRTTSSEFVFTSEPDYGSAASLVIAHETGLIRSNLNGQSAEIVVDSRVTSLGSPDSVAVDSYTDTIFWSSEGSTARVHSKIMSQQPQTLYRNRDRPFGLEYDWVGNRLFWIEDGENTQDPRRAIVGDLENPPTQFVETSGAVATAVDSTNGLFFWSDQTTIHIRTLSGIDLKRNCHTPANGVSSLAVDAGRRNLFWLSSAPTGQNLKISQLDYTSTECNSSTITEQDLPGVSLSSSSTVLVYASNKLFLTSRLSSKIYTVSSHLNSVGVGQTLALGEVKLSGTATNELGSTLEIRDMAVLSTSLQILPGILTPQSRGLPGLEPTLPTREPFLNTTFSNLNTIVIMWGRSEIMGITDPVIYYEVKYSLRKGSTVFNGSQVTTSLYISVEQEGTGLSELSDTNVTASVTAISSWTRSTSNIIASFKSLPPRPGQVQNVRVFLYNPVVESTQRNALIIWDNIGGVVTSFSVRIIDYTNMRDLSPLSEPVLDLKPSYSVLLAEHIAGGNDIAPSFPLMMDQSYGVEVSAVNIAGSGPASERVNFTVSASGSSYPMQVLSLESMGARYYGNSIDINEVLMVEPNASFPVVDAIDRRSYWYNPDFNFIYFQSLGIGGEVVPFLTMPLGTRVVSMTYDWIAKALYVSRVVLSTHQLELIKVEIFDINSQRNVLPNLQFVLPEDTAVNSAIDPISGNFFWSVTGMSTAVYMIDLRDTSITSISPLTMIGSSRRRRKKRATVSTFTSALAVDPNTRMVLVCDGSTGDILQCTQTFSSCMVYVNHSTLGGSNVGLPAGSIKYGGQFIYWTSANPAETGVFAVDLSDRGSLITFSTTTRPRFIVPLSPDQQPLPDIMDLAPRTLPLFGQDVSLVKVTNTTVQMMWQNPSSFIDSLPEIPFSLAAFTFTYENKLELNDDDFLTDVTRVRNILITDLLPFTRYLFTLSYENQYTFKGGFFPTVSILYKTTEGVPDPPAFMRFVVTGTSRAEVYWFELPANALRGPVVNRSYIVSSGEGEISTRNTSAIVSQPDASRLTIQLFSFNGVFRSSRSAVVSIKLWSLVQQPEVSTGNSSIMANVTVPDDFFGDISAVGVVACDMYTSETGGACACKVVNMSHLFFKAVESKPMTILFVIDELHVFTKYCVYPIGNYSGAEVTGGVGILTTTESGVPDAPYISRSGSWLNWTQPNSNGQEITSYRVIFRPASRDVETVTQTLDHTATSYDLETAPIMSSVVYQVTLLASNLNGDGDESNLVTFELDPAFPVLYVAVGAGVGGTLILSALVICVIICCFVKARNTKRELRLSYMYGPDHELSNLRDAMRNAQSSNPHYTWTFDDYVCSDEDMNLLTKFPRNNLKLENFIDRGEFGEVFQGTATDILGAGTGPTPVAVKTLRKGATMEEQRKFLAEAALMGNFNHPNILKVLGVCVDNDPVYIILELMPGGDLLKFLRKAKMDHGPTLLTLPEQVQVALDVAHGCHYLEQQHFIHRDIAARNCLVSSKGADRVVKIGDFGLAKDLYSSDYYQVEGQRKLPVRWMAPEALLQGKFTVESDIWSYGVLLWEIMTLGNQPYPGRINQEVLQFVTGGGRLDRPDKCPSKIYQLMQQCWKRYASDRPHFEHIVNTLATFLERLKRPDSVYQSDSESEEEGEGNHIRQGSNKLPARTPSIRSTGRGIMNLARSGSMKLRNSFRRHNSTHKREEHMTNSQQDDQFRERGPF